MNSFTSMLLYFWHIHKPENMTKLTHEPENKQYYILVEGHKALVEYENRGNTLLLTHTFVPNELRGKGVGNILMQEVFNLFQQQNQKVVPVCPFIVTFIKRHPEFEALVEQ